MSKNYNSTLNSNNTDLQSVLNLINEFPDINANKIELQDVTITPTTSKQTITADYSYDGLGVVTVNAMPTATQATPTITVDNSTGLITATATQTAGYVTAGTKNDTKQLAFQAAKTITPTTIDQVAVTAGTYAGGTITVKGDANLVASNIVKGKSIFGVVGTATEKENEDGLIDGTITVYTNDRVVNIGRNAFYYCSNLTSVNFPICTSIGSSAFRGCTSLTTVSFPKCTTIGSSAFRGCTSLTMASFPVCTIIGSSAFGDCTSLTTVNFPKCSTIGSYAFCDCTSLTTTSFPACTTIRANAFYRCTDLTTVSFPKCTTIDREAFQNCRSLTTVSFPVCTTIGSNAFDGCKSLAFVSFPVCATIGSSAFRGCTKLASIYLMASSVCKLSNSNAFSKAGITSTTGSIFVPTSLVASYKAATNWTYFSNRIFGV